MFNNCFVPQYLGNSSLPSPQSVFPSHWDPGGAQVPSSHVCWPWGQSRVVVPTFRNSVIQYNFAKKLIFQPKIKFSRSLIHNMCRLWVSKCYTCISNAKEKEQINVTPPPLTMYCIFWQTCISFIYIALSICQNIQFYRYMYVRLSTTTTKHSAKTTNIRFIDQFENRQCEKSWKLVICKYTVYSYMVKDVQVSK